MLLKKVDSIKKKENKIKKEINLIKNEKNKIKGGEILSKIPNLLFIPIIGPILYEKNKIELENNPNLIEDLLLFIVNNLINTIEIATIIYILLNGSKLVIEEDNCYLYNFSNS